MSAKFSPDSQSQFATSASRNLRLRSHPATNGSDCLTRSVPYRLSRSISPGGRFLLRPGWVDHFGRRFARGAGRGRLLVLERAGAPSSQPVFVLLE